jgi:hypothetical protein
MREAPTQPFDVYRKRTDPTLRVATARGAPLPPQFSARNWTLMKETSLLHSDVPKDIAVKGYCYFQVLKG